MMSSDWMQEVTADMLPDQYRSMAETIGVDNLLRLMIEFGGTYHYIPKADALMRNIRDRRIVADYNGYNLKQLAYKYQLSEVAIYNILRGSQNAILDGQLSLFDQEEVS